MSAAERKSKKIYYTMGEVSEMFDVNPSLIRFWEQKFDILKPDKNKKGNRLFTPADVENLKLIYHLVKENGMTLAGAQKRIKQNREGLGRDLEIVERLQRIRAMLLEVRQELKGADENVVEIFVDHPSVPAEEHEAGPFPLSGILPETGVAAGDRNREEAGTEVSRTSAAVAAGCAISEWSDTPEPSVPFRLQELWPENEYPQSECAFLPETGPAAGVRPMMRMPWQDRWRWRRPWSKRRLRCPANRKPALWMPFMRRPLRNRGVRRLSSRRFFNQKTF